MNNHASFISCFFRRNRTDDQGIFRACEEFAKSGNRFPAADVEAVKQRAAAKRQVLQQPRRAKEEMNLKQTGLNAVWRNRKLKKHDFPHPFQAKVPFDASNLALIPQKTDF